MVSFAAVVSKEGRNDFGATGCRGPCAPAGHGRHRYMVRFLALEAEPELAAGATRHELERAIEDHVLTGAELVGHLGRDAAAPAEAGRCREVVPSALLSE